MMRVVLAAAGAVMVVSGCECPGPNPPVTCAESIITFDQPASGATVDSPFDVSIAVTTPAGEGFSIDSATLRVGGMSFTGTVSANRATFSGVTATAGAQELSVSIAEGSCSKTATQTVTVRGSCAVPAVTAVRFPQDTQPQTGLLNRAELPPGTSLQVAVDATCVSGVQVRIKRGTEVVGPLTDFMNGTAVVTLPTLPDSDNAQYDLFAELVKDGQAVNTATGAALGSIRVQRALPSCALTTSGTFGPMDDADGSVPGFQMRVVGTMDPSSNGTLRVVGQQPVLVTPSAAGDVSADFTLAGSGTYQAELTCTDAAGNTATASASFTLDFDAPTPSITSPASVDGGATMVVTQSPLTVTVAVPDAEDGSIAIIFRDGMQVGSGTVANGMVTLDAPFGADGDYTLEVRVTDTAGNTGSATLTVSVALSGCGLVFTRPATANALLTPTQLSNGTYSFQTSSKAVCAGQGAKLFRTDLFADGGMSAEIEVGTATLTGAGAANFAPLAMATGDFVFRGEVVNVGVDAGVSTASVNVTVDLDGPSITSPIVPTGQMFATLNAAQDTQPSTPGVQRVLSFSARVPMGGRIDVCITQATDGTGPLSPSPECGSGYFLLRQGVSSPANGFTFPEGSYDLKIVVVGTGITPAPASPPVSLLVDGTRPCVDGLSRSLPQDTNADGRLNIAELAGAQPRLEFALGCLDTPATLSAATPVVVRDVTAGTPGAARASTASFAGGRYTLTLTGPFTAETDLSLFVELTDLAGNKNLLAMTGDPATYALRVDPVAPVCTVASPTATLLGIAQVPGGNLDVVINTSADVGANGVSATFTGQAARSLTPTLNTAQTTYALTGDATYTIGATCTDQAGNATAASARTTRVDLVAPTCNLTAPTNNFVSSSNDVTTTVALTGVSDGDMVLITSSVAGITNNQLTVSGGGTTATRLVRYPNGAQTVTASINDAAGNPCVAPSGGATSAQLMVNSTSCSLDFAAAGPISTNVNGSWLNRAGAGLPVVGATPGSATVSVGAVSSDCATGRNVYLYAGPPSASPSGTPQVTAGGAVTFPAQAFTEGSQYTVTVDNGAGVLTHRSFTVSLAAPTVGTIALQRSATVTGAVTVAKDAALVFGAASGNRRVETATAGDLVFGDLDGATADAQFQLTLSNIDGARVGSLNATLDVLEGSTALMPSVVVNAAAFTPALPRMKLVHRLDDAVTSLVIRVVSPAGNVYVSTHASEVDVIAPTAPSVTQNLTAARAATVGLSWSPVFDDDGNTGSGGLTGGAQPAGYDVRWTTSSVPSNNSMAAEADYFGSSSKQDGITAWSASNINKSLTLPPLNTYFIAVRARDEVGNYSTFAAPTALANLWSTRTITNPSAEGTPSTHNFGQHVISGVSMNGDTVADVVVASPNRGGAVANVGSVFIYWGGVTTDVSTCVAPACQELRPYDSAAGLFGTDISNAGNVGDVSTEAKPDLVVGQPTFQTNVGRAFLYFGTSGTAVNASNYVEFRGVAGIGFASAARIIRDIDGDGLDEIAFSAHTENASQGRVYIFKGRSADPAFNAGTIGANWFNSRTANDGMGNLYIPSSAANWILTGPSPVDSGGNQFARLRWGLISLGDITGDSRNDFVIPVSKDSANGNRVFLYSGATVAAATMPMPTTSALQNLPSPVTITNTGTNEGFGRCAAAGAFMGATGTDLVVSNPRQGRLYVYGDLTAVGAGSSPTATIQGASAPWFGFHFTNCDLNGDARLDLLAGEAPVTGGRAFAVWQRSDGTYEPVVDRVAAAFWISEFFEATSASRQGRMTACADATGDGMADVILGDEGMSRVRIFH